MLNIGETNSSPLKSRWILTGFNRYRQDFSKNSNQHTNKNSQYLSIWGTILLQVIISEDFFIFFHLFYMLPTCGSVIPKQDLISPLSNGTSHFCFCSSVPYLTSTSMLPVSGAEQLNTCNIYSYTLIPAGVYGINRWYRMRNHYI